VRASTLGHGPDTGSAATAAVGEPVWTGPADQVELRASDPVAGVKLYFVAERPPGAHPAAGFALAQPLFDAGGGQPPILGRVAWAGRGAPPARRPAYGNVRLAFVHHTDNPNGYARADVPSMLRAIYDFHRHVRGWNDIGYNFAIDAFGRIWEARQGGIDRPVVGAQAGGYNLVSTGVAVLGTFAADPPPPPAIAALEQLLAWKLSLHGVPIAGRVTVHVDPPSAFYTPFAPGAAVSLPRVAGHRDGDSTDCPGDALYAQLPSIRQRVAGIAGSQARITLVAPFGLKPVAPVTLSGWLVTVGGGPIAGAPIELQELTPAGGRLTLAFVSTAADGSFSASVSVSKGARLRAVHTAMPASVSGELAVR
jgi:hypothetical protein